MTRKLLFALPLLLSGCNTIYGWADGVGKHMPTIGEPCYNWQCMTSSGQEKSDQVKRAEEEASRKSSPSTVPQTPPEVNK